MYKVPGVSSPTYWRTVHAELLGAPISFMYSEGSPIISKKSGEVIDVLGPGKGKR